jgi:hypothetical protein
MGVGNSDARVPFSPVDIRVEIQSKMIPMADDLSDPTLEGALRLTTESPTEVRVDFRPLPSSWKYAHPEFEGEPPWKALARFDTASATIHTFPI